MPNSFKQLPFTVGITTCYGGESILTTVKSLRMSRGVGNFRLVIVADRTPISPAIKRQLRRFRAELIENKTESGIIKKQHQILNLCRSKIIIFTQDDVLFPKDTLRQILAVFASDPKTTFTGVINQPLSASSLLGRAINVGTELTNKIARHWNRGANYLAVIGRVMAFRTDFVRNNFRFPDQVVSSDAFFYLENKRLGGRYQYLADARIYFKNPENFNEHLRKSSRFQHSYREMSQYFSNIDREYRLPKTAVIRALVEQLIASPIKTILYFGVYFYTRTLKLKAAAILNPIWAVDHSTKEI